MYATAFSTTEIPQVRLVPILNPKAQKPKSPKCGWEEEFNPIILTSCPRQVLVIYDQKMCVSQAPKGSGGGEWCHFTVTIC
jgi:hypothetical protein